jgi:hypothetical protein
MNLSISGLGFHLDIQTKRSSKNIKADSNSIEPIGLYALPSTSTSAILMGTQPIILWESWSQEKLRAGIEVDLRIRF